MDQINLPESIRNKLRKIDLAKAELSQGHSAQEVLGITYEQMAVFYRKALKLFNEKSYTDAAEAFLFLAYMNQENHDYWLGLGMATQMCREYEAAIDAYELAAIYDLSSPVPYFYLAKCLFAIHDHKSALEALDLAIEAAQERVEYAELLEQATHAKEVLVRAGGWDF